MNPSHAHSYTPFNVNVLALKDSRDAVLIGNQVFIFRNKAVSALSNQYSRMIYLRLSIDTIDVPLVHESTNKNPN